MKRTLPIMILLIILVSVTTYQEEIVSFVLKEFIYKQELTEYRANNYAKRNNYNYVNLTDNFYPKNKEDIKNVLYTILNSGMSTYSFFCTDEYYNCIDEVEEISTDHYILANINTLVHPYNSYNKVHITTNNFGKIDVNIEKLYTDAEIEEINSKIYSIKQEILKDSMSDRDKIKAFHDYVINNTVYDSERNDLMHNNISPSYDNMSHKANGVLKNHIALCSGYTDLMAIFLSNIGIPNYKIANREHIWNAVYLDGKWHHLDLTWDDPVTTTGENVLLYDFFLISTNELEKLDTEQHIYDKTVYGF